MLTTDDIVVVSQGDKKPASTQFYKRVWLEYGPKDPVKTREKKSGGKVVGEVTVPESDKTVHTSAELLADVERLYKEEFPNSDAWLKALEDMSYGRNLRVTQPIRVKLSPDKPVDHDRAMQDAAKKLAAINFDPGTGPLTTVQEALKWLQAREAAKTVTA
jgi:hypothetical protein